MSLPPNIITGVTARLPGVPAGYKQQAGHRPQHTPGRMNKREAVYALELEARKRQGEIQGWKFEAIKLRLAARTFYTPDFMVWLCGGAVEFHEVKGHWEDDARVKWKIVQEMYPMFRFVLV
jgi:hypothetical protein